MPTQSETLGWAGEKAPRKLAEAFASAASAASGVGEEARPVERSRGAWSDWAPAGVTPWTVGVEEEVMLLDPSDWSLAS